MKRRWLIAFLVCLSTMARAEAFPVFGVDTVSSAFFRDWYQTTDLGHYLDNSNPYTVYETETTGEWNLGDRNVFSVAGNSFKNTRDASMIEFGNPLLTPEYTNAFSLNFLKTWAEHTLSLGTYYRPTTDVMQRIRYQGTYQGQPTMFMTNLNVAKSQSAGAELILKDKLWRILDLTTTLNAYYYKLDGFQTIVEGQSVSGEGNDNFAWDARLLASVILPYNITIQATGNYRSRSVITQGYRRANGSLDLGLRKTFFNKQLALALNWRDVFNSRKFENFTEGPTFWRHQKNHRDPRINLQLTWNFGNMTQKKKGDRDGDEGQGGDDLQGGGDDNNFGGYE